MPTASSPRRTARADATTKAASTRTAARRAGAVESIRWPSRALFTGTRAQGRAFVAWLLVQPARGRGTLAPRTVGNAHDVLRRLFAWASREGGPLDANPCVAPPDNLPELLDRDPEFRATAPFTRAEAEQLVTDARIPEDRRVAYAVLEGSATQTECRRAGLAPA